MEKTLVIVPAPHRFVWCQKVDNATENIASVSSEDQSPLASEVDEGPVVSGEDNSCDDDTEYFTQIFAVKGSFWEGRYQEASLKCVELKAEEQNL